MNLDTDSPAHSDPVKDEVDKATGDMFVDHFVGTAMHYPCIYGFAPHTLPMNSDSADVLIITPIPLITGSVISG